MTYSYVYFISDGIPKGFNYKNLGLFSTDNVFDCFGNTYIKPLLYIHTPINFYSIFFTKDKSIYLFIDSGQNTCYKQEKVLYFGDMGQSYDSLRIYYDTNTKDAAVYNYYGSNKIKIFNLYDLYQGKFKILYQIEAKYNVLQSLIYSYGEEKSILIVIDVCGVRFHNLRGSYGIFDAFSNGRIIEEYDFNYAGMADFIGDGKKLLYIYNNNFVVFELQTFGVVDKKYNLITEEIPLCLLRITDGNVLVGTNKGYIYLIGYKYEEITILDQRKICDENVYSLSYNNNCLENHRECYTFVANCGYLFIFEIGSGH
jgi:hypothetical protein